MDTLKFSRISFLLFLIAFSCKETKEPTAVLTLSDSQKEIKKDTVNTNEFHPQTVNDALALKIKGFLNQEYLKNHDQNAITPDQKHFQLYPFDLNNDAKKEVFVYLNSTYFCGSGGCTILLLSDELKLITKFTVTNPPIFVQPSETKEWKTLFIKSEGEWKELSFEEGTYPSNPTLVKRASNKPSDQAEIIFDTQTEVKTYAF